MQHPSRAFELLFCLQMARMLRMQRQQYYLFEAALQQQQQQLQQQQQHQSMYRQWHGRE
jgi:hypothetical protein